MTGKFALKFAALVLAPLVIAALIFGGNEDTPHSARIDAARTGADTNGIDTREVVLDRHDDGHFYAEAMVDGAPVQFLIDTGASVIALTGSDARAAGIDWTADDITQVGYGAGGTVHGIRVTLNEVRIGDFEAHGIDAAIIPQGLPVSLLGQSFLKRIPDLAIQDDRMVLRN